MTRIERSRLIKQLSGTLGFDRCGIAEAEPIGRADYLSDWLGRGRAGSMEYLHRHFGQRTNPQALLEGAQSVVVVACLYHQRACVDPIADERTRGRVAMYAWGDDYHEVIRTKLHQLVDRMRDSLQEPFDTRVCVDTAPLLEREFAAAAGIGWIGKNTLVLNEQQGSYFFLGAIVTTLDLEPDEPMADHCGTCTACLDACPTGAFPAPYQMDASRCISYLTIEHRGDISRPFQEMMGDWLFGCDVCQEVCPHNRDAPLTTEPRFAARSPGPAPVMDDILAWTPDDYRAQLGGSAMNRAKLDMLKRNARIVKENMARAGSRSSSDTESTEQHGGR